MAIHFDFSGMFAERSGNDYGLKLSDIEPLQEVYHFARKNLQSRRKSGELAFWDLPFDSDGIEKVEQFVSEASQRFDTFVHLGIGGSALGPIALHGSLNHPQHNLLLESKRRGCRFFCPDNVDPDYINSVLDVINPETTLFNVVSKSGGTSETAAQFLLALNILKEKVGASWKDNLVITTDPEKGLLRKFADQHDIKTFPIKPEVGGRFTVLSPVGLLPAAITGINIRELCAGATRAGNSCFSQNIQQNPAALFAALLYLAHMKHNMPIHVMFAYSNRLFPIGDWFRQLWAESLGKKLDLRGREVFQGPTPVTAIGATDQHSQVQLYVEGPADKVVIFLGTKRFKTSLKIPDPQIDGSGAEYLYDRDFGHLLNSEKKGTAFALSQAGRLNMQLELDEINARHIGALMYLLEAATLYAGAFYNVNPLDQPGVEAGKTATYSLMGRKGYEQGREAIESFFSTGKNEMSMNV